MYQIVVSLEEELGLCCLHYCFWAAPSSFLHSLLPLTSNCWNLPFGTQGRSRRRKVFSYTSQRTQKGFRTRTILSLLQTFGVSAFWLLYVRQEPGLDANLGNQPGGKFRGTYHLWLLSPLLVLGACGWVPAASRSICARDFPRPPHPWISHWVMPPTFGFIFLVPQRDGFGRHLLG